MSEVVSLIRDFPCLPENSGEYSTTKAERLALYDIILRTFKYKYNYERAKLAKKTSAFKNQNLDDMKVYSSILNEINTKIKDKFTREYVINTVKQIKNNDFKKQSVRITYDVASKWFDPEKGIYGQTFRSNLATGSDHGTIDFKLFFEVCENEAITETSPWFTDIKGQYEIYRRNYNDLIR